MMQISFSCHDPIKFDVERVVCSEIFKICDNLTTNAVQNGPMVIDMTWKIKTPLYWGFSTSHNPEV